MPSAMDLGSIIGRPKEEILALKVRVDDLKDAKDASDRRVEAQRAELQSAADLLTHLNDRNAELHEELENIDRFPSEVWVSR